jgi:hypothetical protein
VTNIANNNVAGGDWWLVIVNEAGKWIGKIIGAPTGSAMAGSEGTEFSVDENGEVVVSNNGSGSSNEVVLNQESSDTVVQENTATVNNTMDLTANTGDNTASRNTGGDNSIDTGDATIIANIINFVNNNVVGSGRMFVNVINVFGSWLGDFVTPGSEPETDATQLMAGSDSADDNPGSNPLNQAGVGGWNQVDETESGDDEDGDGSDEAATAGGANDSPTHMAYAPALTWPQNRSQSGPGTETVLAAVDSDESEFELPKSLTENKDQKKTINLNLAWLLLMAPPSIVGALIRRKFAA